MSPDETVGVEDVRFTKEAYDLVLALATWPAEGDEPVYLISNLEIGGEACFWYRKRFGIETFFQTTRAEASTSTKVPLPTPSSWLG